MFEIKLHSCINNKQTVVSHNSDFSDRDEAVDIIAEFFGTENVIPVSNFATLQLASLCKDLARIFNVPFELVNGYTNKMRNEAMAEAKKTPGFDAQVWEFTLEVAERDSPSFQKFMEEMEAYPGFKQALNVLFKQQRTVSKHAGGVVITDNARVGMPLIKAKGGLQTPWPEGLAARHLEDFGLLKFDILGLGTLRMFEQVIRKILKKNGMRNPQFKDVKAWFDKNLHPDSNELNDQKVYKNIFWEGKYAGVFQFVQRMTQDFMAEMKPTCINDIAVATSIFRPGPLSAGVDKMFLNNRKNPDKVVFQHPLLKEVFSDTCGLLIFQEQLQQVYHKLAGVPLDETDAVRKAFTKKDISNKAKAAEDRQKLKEGFIEKCKTLNDIKETVSGQLFDEMEKLVAYSFNKSHAVAYAITTYQCAWFLTYYPDEWITTYIDYCTSSKGKVAGKEDPKVVAIQEARRLGYDLVKPDINLSEYEFVNNPQNPKDLIPSVASLKYVGKTALSELKQFRPYTRVEDLLVNPDGSWRHSKFNKRSLDTMLKLEALDSMGLVGPGHTFSTYKELHEVVVVNYDALKRVSARKKNNDVSAEIQKILREVKAKELQDWTSAEKIKFSSDLAGTVDINLVMPPSLKKQLVDMQCKSIDDWSGKGSYWAIISEAKTAKTKTGKPYLRMKLFAESSEEHTCFVWNFKGTADDLTPYSVVAGFFDKSDFGMSTYAGKFYKLNDS